MAGRAITWGSCCSAGDRSLLFHFFEGDEIPGLTGKKGKTTRSVIPILLMRLLYGQDLLDNHQFLVFVDLVKRRVTPGDVKPVDNNPAPEDEFFLSPLLPGNGSSLQRFQGVLIIRRVLSGRRLISSASSCQRIRLKVNP